MAGPYLRQRALGLRRMPASRHAQSASITRPRSTVRSPQMGAGDRTARGRYSHLDRRLNDCRTFMSMVSQEAPLACRGATPMPRRHYRPNSLRQISVDQSRLCLRLACYPPMDSGCCQRATFGVACERTRATRPRVVRFASGPRQTSIALCAPLSIPTLSTPYRSSRTRA